MCVAQVRIFACVRILAIASQRIQCACLTYPIKFDQIIFLVSLINSRGVCKSRGGIKGRSKYEIVARKYNLFIFVDLSSVDRIIGGIKSWAEKAAFTRASVVILRKQQDDELCPVAVCYLRVERWKPAASSLDVSFAFWKHQRQVASIPYVHATVSRIDSTRPALTCREREKHLLIVTQ